jgi:cell pole-organizing protein PopZ
MSADAAAAEPTMEEILASIRRIISEDDKPAEAAPPEEVLELTEPVAPEPILPKENNSQDDIDSLFDTPEPVAEAAPEELIVTDWPEPEPEPAPTPAPEPVYQAPEPRPVVAAPATDTLISSVTASAASSALSRLQSISNSAVGLESVGGITVEALARELMRPMLKEWLDANLPAIVEAQVAAEVARIGRGL